MHLGNAWACGGSNIKLIVVSKWHPLSGTNNLFMQHFWGQAVSCNLEMLKCFVTPRHVLAGMAAGRHVQLQTVCNFCVLIRFIPISDRWTCVSRPEISALSPARLPCWSALVWVNRTKLYLDTVGSHNKDPVCYGLILRGLFAWGMCCICCIRVAWFGWFILSY